MRVVWSSMAWMAILVVGCIAPSEVPCGDGRVCPVGYTCSASYCFSAEQITACEGGDDGTACTTSVGPGVCSEQGCIIPVCGNGTVEPTEICDDGNSTKDDGCSPKCDSNEVCGNGFVDYLQGEQCDDTNLRTNDGCNARCQLEYRVWRPHTPGGIQTTRHLAAAYDSARKRLVVFGGSYPSQPIADTFELENTSWFKRPLARSPVARYDASMVYDSKRQRIVLFGGETNDGIDATTWEYDGTAWYEIATAAQPPARKLHAMAYDSARERVVVFGGENYVGALRDTWEYDGSTWVETTPASGGPSARANTALAYDPIRGTAILYGGRDPAQSGPYNDTWLYNGTWSASAATASTGRSGMSLTFDPTRGMVVMAGGTSTNETNTFDGTTWTLQDFGGANRVGHVAAFDERRQRLVMWGGLESGTTESFKLDELTDTGWSNVPLTVATTPYTVYPSIAFDTARGQLITFGGYYGFPGSGFPGNEVYAMGDFNWTQLVTTGGPPAARYRSAIAYDPVRNLIVAFGGQTDDTTVVGDTWELDGTTWTQRTPTSSPSPRAGHRMVYDSARKKIVLFGGDTPTPQSANDELWEYDTATHLWTKITLSGAPEARADFGMAFDSRRGRVVVWGAAATNDTWFYDGTVWTHTASTSPPNRQAFAMTYDSARDRVVMHGGGTGSPKEDTWELDGTEWRVVPRLPQDPAPPTGKQHAIAYDPARARVILLTLYAADVLVYVYGTEQTEGNLEVCTSGHDGDGDTKIACADDDCWGVCTPHCPPDSSCTIVDGCGDGTCDPVESCRTCPADCPVGGSGCPQQCGDSFCEGTETIGACPGDCG